MKENTTALVKAQEAFKVYAAIQGFDIQGFDRWLPSLHEYDAFVELTERRQAALEAMLANDESTALRHMEWMLLRWRSITELMISEKINNFVS